MKTLCTFLTICLFATAAAAATIGGTVTRLGTAVPLPSMTVAAYDATGVLRATATTDAQGRYTVTVGEGTYRLLAFDAAGVYATSFYDNAESFDTSRQLTLQTAQSVTSVNFALARAGSIAGVVTAASSPRAGITVAAYNLSGTLRGFTKTDANGAYRLVLPAGTYKVAAFDEARVYATSFHRESASFGGASSIVVSADATTSIDFSLSNGARVRGRVTEAGSGVALFSVTVTAYDAAGHVAATTLTASNGTYELFLPAGSYRLVFEDRTGTFASEYYAGAESFDTSTRLAVAADETLANVDAALQRAARIFGTVRAADTGAGLASIVVAAYNASGTVRAFTTTDATGTYILTVPAGSYRVGAYDTNVVYASQFYLGQPAFAYGTTISVAEGITLGPVEFGLRRGGRLSGRVSDRATGASLESLTVAAYDLSGTRITSVRTAADGTYRLVLPAGVYKLVAFDEALHYANGYLDGATNVETSRTISVAAGIDVTALNFSMSVGASVSGNVVTLASGEPVPGIIVTAYDLAGVAIASFTTGAAGNFAFAVPPGTYRFVAADPRHRFATSYYQNASGFNDARSVTLIAGGTAPAATFHLTVAPSFGRRRAARH
ncbi:MAG TPA: carboxypeptidase regulatory-like domain-containing protein [Thermoanaerobaculia bacterium]|jgi:hypothetical protein